MTVGGSLAPPGCKKSNPFLDLPGGSGAVTYRRGWLARKVLAEADGKKSEWGGTWGGGGIWGVLGQIWGLLGLGGGVRSGVGWGQVWGLLGPKRYFGVGGGRSGGSQPLLGPRRVILGSVGVYGGRFGAAHLWGQTCGAIWGPSGSGVQYQGLLELRSGVSHFWGGCLLGSNHAPKLLPPFQRRGADEAGNPSRLC